VTGATLFNGATGVRFGNIASENQEDQVGDYHTKLQFRNTMSDLTTEMSSGFEFFEVHYLMLDRLPKYSPAPAGTKDRRNQLIDWLHFLKK
jgi:hypothetical protein